MITNESLASAIDRILAIDHIGESNAIKGKNLRWILTEYFDEPIGERRIREAIEELIPHVASSARGYYIAANVEEAERAARHYEKHIIALARRRRAILGRYHDENQMRMGI